MASGDITSSNYQATVKHQLGIVVDGDYTTGSYCRHVEIASGYVLVAYETPTGIAIRIGVKDGLACVPFSTTNDATLTGTYTIEDFIAMSTTKALLVLRETGGNIFCAAVTFTAPATLAIAAAVDSGFDAVTLSIKACLIDTSKVIIAYKDTSDSKPYIVVCSCAVTTPTFGSAVKPKDATVTNATSISVCKCTTTTFFVTYDNGTNLYGHIMTFDGTTTITANTENAIQAALGTYVRCALLDSTHVVIVYNDVGNSSYITGIVAVISGTTISSYGSEVVPISTTAYVDIVVLSSSKFAIVGVQSNAAHSWSYIATVSGTTIVWGTAANISNWLSGNGIPIFSVKYIDATHYSFVIYDTGASVRRVFYGVVTSSGVNTATFNQMTVRLCKASGENIMISLLSAINNIANKVTTIYINGNETANKCLNINMFDPTAVTDSEFGRGVLRLANSPISVNDGYGIYIGTANVANAFTCVLSALGLEEEV